MNKSFAESVVKKIIADKGSRVELLVLKDESGVENYLYLMISESEFLKLQQKINNGESIEPEKHGLVLYQGHGNTPSKEVEDMIDKAISAAETNY